MKIQHLLLIGGWAALLPVWAQDQISDRPGGTESTELAAPGSTIIELDLLYTDNGPDRTYEVPQILARYGLTPRLEAIVGWDGQIFSEDQENQHDPQPIQLGFKIHLAEESKRLPAIGLFALTGIAFQTPPYKCDDIEPDLRLLFSKTLSDAYALDLNLGMESPHSAPSFIFTFALGWTLSETCQLTSEMAGYHQIGSSSRGIALSQELALALSEKLELRLQAGAEATNEEKNIFLDAGLTIQL